MENNETFVTEEEVTENVEQTTEEIATEPEKIYTEDEMNARVNEILGKKIARREAKIRKEYDRKYGDLVDTLRAGTGKETVEEMTDTFKGFYEKKGITIPKKPEYSEKDIEVLARAEADEYIGAGLEEAIEEAERLKELGVPNMTAKEKAVFSILAKHIERTEKSNELARIGVPEDVYNSKEFQDFAEKFTSSTPIREVYDLYTKTKPKKDYKTMGSMKHSQANEKDYYSSEDIDRLTEEDLDNPEVWEKVRRSMTGR